MNMSKNDIKCLNAIKPYTLENLLSLDSLVFKLGRKRRGVQTTLSRLKCMGHPVGCVKRDNWHGIYMARTPQELEIGMSADIKQAESTLESVRIRRNTDLDEYWREAAIAH